ncbi:MAG: hypothetical protein JXR94_08560 [Candidatus Hydrogenedentes bacterium]|nr:hypothetical protein [Candidatus Hydrogenedentota bacterium]
MGLRIGQDTADLFGMRGRSLIRERAGTPSLPGQASDSEDEPTAAALFNREKPEPPQIGFGEGTVSIPGLAVRAIDKNFNGTRRIVPTLEEAQNQVRERLAEQRGLFADDDEGGAGNREVEFVVDRGAALAATRTRQYINSLEEAAELAAARFNGEDAAEDDESGATIRVGDEVIAIRQNQGLLPRIDVRI